MPLIVLLYGMAMLTVYRRELTRRDKRRADTTVDGPESESRAVFWEFGVAAAVVVAAGLWLPFVGERMAVALDMHETFVGIPRGDPRNPLTDGEIEDKFRNQAEYVLGDDEIERVISTILDFEKLEDISELMSLLAG